MPTIFRSIFLSERVYGDVGDGVLQPVDRFHFHLTARPDFAVGAAETDFVHHCLNEQQGAVAA